MTTPTSIKVTQLEEGYIIETENPERRYAVSKSNLIIKIKSLFNITYKYNKKQKQEEKQDQNQDQDQDQDQDQGDEQGTCDDVTFESCFNKDNAKICKMCIDKSKFKFREKK